MPDLDVLIDACIDKVRRFGGVTFHELGHVLAEHDVDAKGMYSVEIRDLNIVLWSGMSDIFSRVVQSERFRQAAKPSPAHVLTYITDGGVLDLPIAERPPKNGYRERHWAPVVFNAA